MTTIRRLIMSLYIGGIMFVIDTLASLYIKTYLYDGQSVPISKIVVSRLINFVVAFFVVYFLLDRRSQPRGKGERREQDR